eukprot:2301648-Rhodomonas_salina.1
MAYVHYRPTHILIAIYAIGLRVSGRYCGTDEGLWYYQVTASIDVVANYTVALSGRPLSPMRALRNVRYGATLPAYARHMRCPVLTARMVLQAEELVGFFTALKGVYKVRYQPTRSLCDACTELAYAATRKQPRNREAVRVAWYELRYRPTRPLRAVRYCPTRCPVLTDAMRCTRPDLVPQRGARYLSPDACPTPCPVPAALKTNEVVAFLKRNSSAAHYEKQVPRCGLFYYAPMLLCHLGTVILCCCATELCVPYAVCGTDLGRETERGVGEMGPLVAPYPTGCVSPYAMY